MLMWKYYGIARLEEEEGNRSDLVVADRREKVINVVEMACTSWRNRRKTDTRKTENGEENGEEGIDGKK